MSWGHPERGKVLLLAGDSWLAAAALQVATTLRAENHLILPPPAESIAIFVAVFSVCFYVFDLYDIQLLNRARMLTRLFTATLMGTCLLSLFLVLFHSHVFTRGAIDFSVPLLFGGSYLWRRFYAKHGTSLFPRRDILLIGTKEEAGALHSILESKNSQYKMCGFLRLRTFVAAVGAGAQGGCAEPLYAGTALRERSWSHGTVALEEPASLPLLFTHPEDTEQEAEIHDFGTMNGEMFEHLTSNHGINVIVVPQDSAVAEYAESLTRLRFQGVRISTMPDFCGEILEELPLDTLSDMWLSFATGFHLLHHQAFRKMKRLADILLASSGLLITLPISSVVAIAIKLESPGPVFLRQWRVGWMERPFVLFKFRSMREDAESDGRPRWAATADLRVTRVGKILRRLHIDEIPQMMNVLLGEMSFVGPRPERPAFVEQLKRLIPFYSLRHHVPPGITGWAQVNYPYGASVEDAKRKLQFDLFYVRNASPTMDLRILLRTVRVILFRRGSR